VINNRGDPVNVVGRNRLTRPPSIHGSRCSPEVFGIDIAGSSKGDFECCRSHQRQQSACHSHGRCRLVTCSKIGPLCGPIGQPPRDLGRPVDRVRSHASKFVRFRTAAFRSPFIDIESSVSRSSAERGRVVLDVEFGFRNKIEQVAGAGTIFIDRVGPPQTDLLTTWT